MENNWVYQLDEDFTEETLPKAGVDILVAIVYINENTGEYEYTDYYMASMADNGDIVTSNGEIVCHVSEIDAYKYFEYIDVDKVLKGVTNG